MEASFEYVKQLLNHLIEYGPVWIYLALVVASFIENIFPPFPGDFFTITGGAMAASFAELNIFLVFLAVYFGGIASTILVYYFGHRFGRSFFLAKNYKYFSSGDRKTCAWIFFLKVHGRHRKSCNECHSLSGQNSDPLQELQENIPGMR